MGRKRQSNRHLPANMQHRHGRYYFVRCGKWTPLAKDYGPALMEYAALVGTPQSVYSVKDAIWQYIEHAGHRKADPLSEKTLEGYRYSATNLCAVFGKLALSDLTRPMVYRYLVDTGTVQANRDKALLSAAYTHAGNMGHFTGVDPTKRTQFRNEEKPRQRYVTDAELTKLIDHAPPKLACIARFIELTGMRQGDALRVRLSDLDAEGIHYTQGKTGKRLVVLWSPELEAVVADARKQWRRFGREYLFESRPQKASDDGKRPARPPGPYTPSGLRAMWRRVRVKAGLLDTRLHDLRRKAGSDVATLGEAQGLLGHADGKVTGRHYRAKPERVKPVR
jgi:integrase